MIFLAPFVKSKDFWRHKRGYKVCKGCRKDLQVTTGTVLHGERIPLRVIFIIAWFLIISKQGISAKELSSILQENHKTVWTWLHKLRRIMVLPVRNKLLGNVEVDEVFVGGSKSGKRGRGAEGKEIIVIAVEIKNDKANKKGLIRGMGRVRISVISDCKKVTLKKFILDNIEPGSTLFTADWRGYNDIEK